jgi:hypothetical protein
LVSDGVAVRARATAASIEPCTAMWLSLMMTPSSRARRWLRAPPTAVAYFDSARNPGRVLRVSTKVAPVPFTRSA